MRIFIKKLDGRTRVFNFYLNQTVEEVHRIIEIREGIPVRQQRLIFGHPAVQLDHGRTLAEYNIGDGSTIHLLLRIAGD
jgi:hypothetical protein